MSDSLTQLIDNRDARESLAAAWDIHRFEVLSSTISTQEVARHLAEWEQDEWVLVATDFQSGGRGQHGRKWISPPGTSLMFSLALRPRDPATMAVLPIRVGLAIAGAIDPGLAPRIRLKWPNDLICGQRKCGGILCEGTTRGDESLAVIGVGLNVRSFQIESDDLEGREPAFLVDLLGQDADRLDLLSRIVPAIRSTIATNGTELREEELKAYRDRDWLMGQRISAPVSGTAIGIDKFGRLMVEADGGELKVVVAGRIQIAPSES